MLVAVAGVAALAPGARAADEGLVAAAGAPVAVFPTAATVGGEPTAVLAAPGTVTFQLPLRVSLTSVDGHPSVPSGGLSLAIVAMRRLEVSFAAIGIPLDAVYGAAEGRVGTRIALRQEGALRVSLLADGHASMLPYMRQSFAIDAGVALTHCRDQACRASATLFGIVDRHRASDSAFDEAEIHFVRSQAAAGASATLPFGPRGNLFASGRASTTFGCGDFGGVVTEFTSIPSCTGPASTLLTATAGARFASLDGRQAFDIAVSVLRGRLEEFSLFRSIPYASFLGATFTTALGGRGP